MQWSEEKHFSGPATKPRWHLLSDTSFADRRVYQETIQSLVVEDASRLTTSGCSRQSRRQASLPPVLLLIRSIMPTGLLGLANEIETKGNIRGNIA
jgi:hypothetical protein